MQLFLRSLVICACGKCSIDLSPHPSLPHLSVGSCSGPGHRHPSAWTHHLTDWLAGLSPLGSDLSSYHPLRGDARDLVARRQDQERDHHVLWRDWYDQLAWTMCCYVTAAHPNLVQAAWLERLPA